MEQITCDLIPGGKMPLLHASQYDEGREYRINLTENKQAYTLDGTELLTISVRKGDNTLFTADIANTFGGKSYVDFVSTEQMCAVAGYNFGELSITKNNTRIGTVNFMLVCEPSPEASGLTSESEINNLDRQITDEVDKILPDLVEDIAPAIVEEVAPSVVREVAPAVIEDVVPPILERLAPSAVEDVAPSIVERLVPAEVAEVAPAVVREVAAPIVEELVPIAVGDNYYNKTQMDGFLDNKLDKNVGTKARFESIDIITGSAANGRPVASVGSVISFGTQVTWVHVKYAAVGGKTYRATYFSHNSTTYANIVATDSDDKVLAILNDSSPGSGGHIMTKEFTAPAGTAFIYMSIYGDITNYDASMHLEEAKDLRTDERLDDVEDISTQAIYNLTNNRVANYYNNVSYPDGDYTDTKITTYVSTPSLTSRGDVPNAVVIAWKPVRNLVKISVIVSKDNNFFYARYKAYDCDPDASSIAIYNLEPNATYYYRVLGMFNSGIEMTLAIGNFATNNSVVRMLKIDGIQNVRDIGGKTAGANTVKYGLIIRGSELDGKSFSSNTALTTTNGTSLLTNKGRTELLNHIGIRAELDLRASGTWGIISDLDYQSVSFPFYADVLSGAGLTALKSAFDFILAHVSANKPVYAHCSGGNDRTGTLMTCLLGLLGVSESDLSKEYELSSFVFGETRPRNSTTYDYKGLMTGVLALTGATLRDKFETLFTNAGVSVSDITAFRTAMLS